MRKILATLAAATIALLGLVWAPPANADDWSYFDDLESEQVWTIDDQVQIRDCWNSPARTYFQVKYGNRWKTVASSTGKRNSKYCRNGAYLAVYNWTVDTTAKPNSTGERWLTVGVYSSGRRWTTKVEMDEPSDGPATNQAVPAPEATQTAVPAPAPVAPVATPTPSPTGTFTDAQMDYTSYLWGRMKTNGVSWTAETCQKLTMASFAKDFYDTAAFTGEQLFKMPSGDARLAAKLAFSVRCEQAFGIKIVTNA